MITGHKKYFIQRCVERGYSLQDALACVVYQDDDMWTVDETHPAYPKEKESPQKTIAVANRSTDAVHSRSVPKVQVSFETFKKIIAEEEAKRAERLEHQQEQRRIAIERQKKRKLGGGVGTELKKLLAKIGITATPTCSCNKRAQFMDEQGIDWCKENIDLIVSWLREEAERRRLPFVDFAGKLLVKRAISLAEKAEKKRLAEKAQENAADG